MKFEQGSGGKIDLLGGGHADHDGWLIRLEDTFGTRGKAFALSQLNQLILACQDKDGEVDGSRLDAMIAMVEAATPDNELQAALAVQMAITHFATVTIMRRALRVDQIPQFDSAGNMAIKLARTFALQAETLAKLQRGGEQVVRVVHVHPGAQAIVGNVNAGEVGPALPRGGVSHENASRPHAKAILPASSTSGRSPLRSEDAQREPMPLTGRQR
ncbi:MAG: hypothetical protein H6876_06860 [Hyphomicrobiaceae bacterium]|nr:hypothetical protein [Hyphomicrobiaceae bacterium]